METRVRTLAKTLSWRAVATVITALLAWGITGEKSIGIAIGLSDTLVKLFAYYFHERMWTHIRFGPIDYAPPTGSNKLVGKHGDGI